MLSRTGSGWRSLVLPGWLRCRGRPWLIIVIRHTGGSQDETSNVEAYRYIIDSEGTYGLISNEVETATLQENGKRGSAEGMCTEIHRVGRRELGGGRIIRCAGESTDVTEGEKSRRVGCDTGLARNLRVERASKRGAADSNTLCTEKRTSVRGRGY